MSLVDLPPELTHAIFDNLRGDRKQLCAISLVCHVLHDQAVPLLYSNVRISSDSIQLILFAQTMLENPYLASFVTSFYGPLYPEQYSFGSFELLKGWLQNVVNLKSLHIIFLHDPRAQPFPKCRFRLKFLEFNCPVGLAAMENFLEDQVDLFSITPYFSHSYRPMPLFGSAATESFFENQVDLVSNTPYFSPSYRPKSLSPLACPKLKVLKGDILSAKAFLPGRHIVRYEYDRPGPDSSIPLNEIADQLNNLRSLSYITTNITSPISAVHKLPNKYLHSLLFLEISTMHADDWISIPTLPRLRVLLVLESSNVHTSLLDEPHRLLELFSKCPTIQHIDVGGRYHLTTLSCSRWLRGVEEPIIIPLQIAEQGRMEFLDDGKDNS